MHARAREAVYIYELRTHCSWEYTWFPKISSAYLRQTKPSGLGGGSRSLLLEVTPLTSPKGKGGKHRCNSKDRTVQSAKKGSRTETATSIPLVNPEEPGFEPVVCLVPSAKGRWQTQPTDSPGTSSCPPATQLVLSQVSENCHRSVGTLWEALGTLQFGP